MKVFLVDDLITRNYVSSIVWISVGGQQLYTFYFHTVNQANCNKFPNPVCDNSESSHTSLCSFLTTQSYLDYLSYCKVRLTITQLAS